MQSAATKQAFVEQESLARRTKAADRVLVAFYAAQPKIARYTTWLQNSTKNSTNNHARLPMRHMQRLQLLIGAACAHLNGARHKRNEASAR